MKTRSGSWLVVVLGVAVGAASCTQIFEANKDYQLTGSGGTGGTGGATSASTSGQGTSSASTSGQGTGGSGGGTACAPACGEGEACCGTTCADLASDPTNCGMCGEACTPGATCGATGCTCGGGADCKGGQACCGADGCKDLTADVTSCGMCGNACPASDDCSASGCSDWAKWPMPNPLSTGLPNPAAYMSMPGYVLDNVTGLWWQHPIDANNNQNKNCSAGCTVGDAITYCANLTIAGQSDWRLPTRIELVSIVDYTQHIPAIEPTAFAGTPLTGVGPFPGNDDYWTSSPSPANFVFFVEFAEGDTASGGPFAVNVVRCVRGTANPGTPHYTVKTGTVLDSWTGLTWQQTVSAQLDTWDNAKADCANNSAGLPGSGWRLPSMKELQTLVDDSRMKPAIDPAAFPSTPFDVGYWTSSPVVFGPPDSRAWYVQFDLGQSPYDLVGHPYHFRCVR